MSVDGRMFGLVVLFGSSSWLGTNSVWMQLPLLTSVLPEGWGLPSYLAMVVQIACIGPLVYGILHKCCCKMSSVSLIIAALALACVCQAALAGLWEKTATLFGGTFSLYLYVLMFGIALVNATSNVLFMPFMATYHSSLLNAYFVGMGLSSLVPSILSLIQGTSNYECVMQNGTNTAVYSPPRFGVSVYFSLIAAWTIAATASFLLMTRKTVSKETNANYGQKVVATESSPLNEEIVPSGDIVDDLRISSDRDPQQPYKHTTAGHIFMLFLTALVNAQMNGIIPSVHSYAALPYSQIVYHLGLTLSNIVAPVASFLPLFYAARSLPAMALLTSLSSLTTAFIIFLGLLSPSWFLSREVGGSLSVVTSVIAAGLHSYLRTLFAAHLREAEGDHTHTWLFWCGVFIQIGSFIGSAIMFPLVNFSGLFESAKLCQ